MGKLAQAFFNAIGPESFSSDSEINKGCRHRECRYSPVNSARQQQIIALSSLSKKPEQEGLH